MTPEDKDKLAEQLGATRVLHDYCYWCGLGHTHQTSCPHRASPWRQQVERAERAEARVAVLENALRGLCDELDALHQPEWASDAAKAAGKKPWVCVLCGTADGHWPCDTVDEVAAARAVLEEP